MALTAKAEGGVFERPPTGMQAAVCSAVHDLGMQAGFQGKVQHKVVIVWELAERRKEGEFAGKRFTVSKTYTLSLFEKATLSADLENWRGKAFAPEEREAGFDLEKLLGANATLNLIEKTNQAGRTFVVVAGVMPKLKAVEQMIPEEANFMPKWVKELLDKGPAAGAEVTEGDESIPF